MKVKFWIENVNEHTDILDLVEDLDITEKDWNEMSYMDKHTLVSKWAWEYCNLEFGFEEVE